MRARRRNRRRRIIRWSSERLVHTMSGEVKQEILEALREIVERLDGLGGADSVSFGKLIVNIAVSAGHQAEAVWEIPDPLFLEAARSLLGGLRELKETEASPRKMWVQSVDQDGNQIGEAKEVIVPAPELVPQDGLARLSEYVSRLYHSEAAFASLIIFRQDRQAGISALRRGGKATLNVTVNWRQNPQQEQAVRQFFDSRRLTPDQDYLSGNGGSQDDLLILLYPGGESAEDTADLCRSFLREVHGVTQTEGLMYFFQEG